MKRYSISTSYDWYKLQYDGRTDDPQKTIEWFRKCIAHWKEELNNENYEYRDFTRYRWRMRITDSKTKEIVFDETHTCEEFGWKVILEEKRGQYCIYTTRRFERI